MVGKKTDIILYINYTLMIERIALLHKVRRRSVSSNKLSNKHQKQINELYTIAKMQKQIRVFYMSRTFKVIRYYFFYQIKRSTFSNQTYSKGL